MVDAIKKSYVSNLMPPKQLLNGAKEIGSSMDMDALRGSSASTDFTDIDLTNSSHDFEDRGLDSLHFWDSSNDSNEFAMVGMYVDRVLCRALSSHAVKSDTCNRSTFPEQAHFEGNITRLIGMYVDRVLCRALSSHAVKSDTCNRSTFPEQAHIEGNITRLSVPYQDSCDSYACETHTKEGDLRETVFDASRMKPDVCHEAHGCCSTKLVNCDPEANVKILYDEVQAPALRLSNVVGIHSEYELVDFAGTSSAQSQSCLSKPWLYTDLECLTKLELETLLKVKEHLISVGIQTQFFDSFEKCLPSLEAPALVVLAFYPTPSLIDSEQPWLKLLADQANRKAQPLHIVVLHNERVLKRMVLDKVHLEKDDRQERIFMDYTCHRLEQNLQKELPKARGRRSQSCNSGKSIGKQKPGTGRRRSQSMELYRPITNAGSNPRKMVVFRNAFAQVAEKSIKQLLCHQQTQIAFFGEGAGLGMLSASAAVFESEHLKDKAGSLIRSLERSLHSGRHGEQVQWPHALKVLSKAVGNSTALQQQPDADARLCLRNSQAARGKTNIAPPLQSLAGTCDASKEAACACSDVPQMTHCPTEAICNQFSQTGVSAAQDVHMGACHIDSPKEFARPKPNTKCIALAKEAFCARFTVGSQVAQCPIQVANDRAMQTIALDCDQDVPCPGQQMYQYSKEVVQDDFNQSDWQDAQADISELETYSSAACRPVVLEHTTEHASIAKKSCQCFARLFRC